MSPQTSARELDVHRRQHATAAEQHEPAGRPRRLPLRRECVGLVRVLTSFGKGDVRPSYATELSFTRAFILSMRPPSIRSTVSVQICPADQPPLVSLDALVIGIRVDPADAERTGFEVAFTQVDAERIGALDRIVTQLAQARRAHSAVAVPEHPTQPAPAHVFVGESRCDPRVATDLRALIDGDADDRPLSILNLSLSGALVGIPDGRPVFGAEPGAVLSLTIVAPDEPESIAVQARVVRRTGPGEPHGFGVRFVDMDPLTERRIEGLLLESVARGRLEG